MCWVVNKSIAGKCKQDQDASERFSLKQSEYGLKHECDKLKRTREPHLKVALNVTVC
jgi:hypothetical protein